MHQIFLIIFGNLEKKWLKFEILPRRVNSWKFYLFYCVFHEKWRVTAQPKFLNFSDF